MPINKAWHQKHKMPKSPTEAQRLVWHMGHAKHCTCRPLPPTLAAMIRKAGHC